MELLGSLNIDPKAVVINVVGFVLLLLIANRLVFKPVGRLLAERQQDINGGYDKLEAEQLEMQTLRVNYEQRLTGIEAEAREKIQSAIKEAQTARDQILQETAARQREMLQRAEQDIQHEREQALITIRQQVVDLALGATRKVIGDNLDETRQRRLIDDFITSGTSAAAPVAAPAARNGGAVAYEA